LALHDIEDYAAARARAFEEDGPGADSPRGRDDVADESPVVHIIGAEIIVTFCEIVTAVHVGRWCRSS
jgi:hypothetical protein